MAFGLFLLVAVACVRFTRGAWLPFCRILGESAAAVLVVSGFGVLADHQRLATRHARTIGLVWFCCRGGVHETIGATFVLGPFGIAALWLIMPLTSLAVAYLLMTRDA
jgi:hypothetical protein